jgi:hypothetical protein
MIYYMRHPEGGIVVDGSDGDNQTIYLLIICLLRGIQNL